MNLYKFPFRFSFSVLIAIFISTHNLNGKDYFFRKREKYNTISLIRIPPKSHYVRIKNAEKVETMEKKNWIDLFLCSWVFALILSLSFSLYPFCALFLIWCMYMYIFSHCSSHNTRQSLLKATKTKMWWKKRTKISSFFFHWTKRENNRWVLNKSQSTEW